jgi:dCMP deaminase
MDGQGNASEIVIAYVPVVHQGYLRFFESLPTRTKIGILSEELTQPYEPIEKDIRRLSAAQIITSLRALFPSREIELIEKKYLRQLNQVDQVILMPDEDISRQVADEYLPNASITFASVFLRWDRSKTIEERPPKPGATIPVDSFAKKMVSQACELGQQSADWWRRVGALLIKDGEILLQAMNHHLPHQQQPYILGDPRANFHKGEQIELSTAIHAEASLIAEAARRGLTVAGAQLYASTFPCPVCAKLVAESGITEVYYGQGYAMLDGEEIFASKNIKVTAVDHGPSQV